MKIESKSDAEEIKLNMTAMIDIVFQLLVFFIMTFKIVALEGDFSVKMPQTSDTPIDRLLDELPNTIKVRLIANENGDISTITASDSQDETGQTFGEGEIFQKLQDYVETRIAGGTDPTASKKTELEFDIDYGLKYTWTVTALDKVSGRVQQDGTIKKLIEQIKFKDNSQSN